jgi:dTDP-4-amino-4,6-dideoxygalactose transaminase
MEFIDLKTQQRKIRKKIESRILQVLDHGSYVMGPEIVELEKRLSEYIGVRHSIACSSGTDALLMGLMAYGVGPGDAVLTSPFTFIATAEVIRLLGAVPVYVDIDPATYNIDPNPIESAIEALEKRNLKKYPLPRNFMTQNLRIRGIIPVDLFGIPAEYDPICEIAQKRGLFVMEDAAQSFGAEYRGKKAGTLAPVACTSFFPAKPLGCYGDGGAVFLNDDSLAQVIDSIRVHGKGTHKYDNARIGINGRMDTLQAGILLAKMEIFPEEVELRQIVARNYSQLLQGIPSITLPSIPKHIKSVFAQYSILAQNESHRDHLQKVLKEKGIPTAVYYPKPLHLQTAFQNLGYQSGDFPVSEDCSRRIFSLPMHPYLTGEEQEKIAEAVRSAA